MSELWILKKHSVTKKITRREVFRANALSYALLFLILAVTLLRELRH